jgi:hypothetical protein
VLAVERPDRALRNECTRYHGKVELALDPAGVNARRFNAGWRPRAYAIGADGSLIYIQPETTPDGDAPLEFRQIAGRF